MVNLLISKIVQTVQITEIVIGKRCVMLFVIRSMLYDQAQPINRFSLTSVVCPLTSYPRLA